MILFYSLNWKPSMTQPIISRWIDIQLAIIHTDRSHLSDDFDSLELLFELIVYKKRPNKMSMSLPRQQKKNIKTRVKIKLWSVNTRIIDSMQTMRWWQGMGGVLFVLCYFSRILLRWIQFSVECSSRELIYFWPNESCFNKECTVYLP